ncbi:unnamed protein product [Knipowitschia caucasica]|uniref:Uncharacterized protein n=1 Tax=Knipowitschia caucasica TaxID=637954 RepID=A0AAV2KM12_KNICA
MAAESVRLVLQTCDPQLLDLGDSDVTDFSAPVEASNMLLFLTDSRRMQKVLWKQLFVLDSVMSLIEDLKSGSQLLQVPCPKPADGAHGRWKDLKLQYRTSLEETEELLRTQLQKVEEIKEKREKINQLLLRIQQQSAQRETLQSSLLFSHEALRHSEAQLQEVMAKAEVTASHMVDWERIRDDLQVEVSLVQDLMEMTLLSLSPSELLLEIRPGSGRGHDLEPLKVSVKWDPDDTFSLQVSEEVSGLMHVSSSSDLRLVLQEVLQQYSREAQLLTEIQVLRSSFAIDWRPSQRRLVFLKSATVVCELEVEEEYPSRGGVRLLSVQRDGTTQDTGTLQNQEEKLSLTQWLLLLSSSSQV